jgi:hypothetical protein
MTLLELQRRMSSAVMQPMTKDFRMRNKSADGRTMKAVAADFIKPNSRLTSFERLEIYNQQYWYRIVSALSEDFPGLCRILGEKKFDAMILAYLAENPSSTFTLRNLGSNLVSWLRTNPQWTGATPELAIDVARLEWGYVEAFDNAEYPAITTEDFAGIADNTTFTLQPHVRLLDLSYPVDDLVLAVHREQPASDVVSNAVSSKHAARSRKRFPGLRPSTTFLVVHRFDFSVYYKRVQPEAFRLLRAMENRVSLGEALDMAFAESAATPAEQAGLIQTWFLNWSELGWFCKAELGEPSMEADPHGGL